AGQLGLAGQVYEFGSGSPFDVQGATAAWLRELHGFTWLGSLKRAETDEADTIARRIVLDWCQRRRNTKSLAAEAALVHVRARRLGAWLVNAGMLLEGAPHSFHHAFTRALGHEISTLSRQIGSAPSGPQRLACWMVLALACLSLAGHDRHLPRIERALASEFKRQFHHDGGHVSRNNDVVLELLLDLLPLRQCYLARGIITPPFVSNCISAMTMALKAGSTTSRELARFNGVGISRSDTLALVLSLDETLKRPETGIADSRYARLQQAGTTVIVDCGSPPPLQYASQAHAGCLSFELGSDDEAVIVNRGAPGPGHQTYHPDARATASHSTLTIADQSSSRLVRSKRLEGGNTPPPIGGPDHVRSELTISDHEIQLISTHDGYLKRFGLLHERRLTLKDNGTLLEGLDILRGPHPSLRLPHDLPVAIRFQIPVGSHIASRDEGYIITTHKGVRWRLSAEDCDISCEANIDFAQALGPTKARMIVLRSTCTGESQFSWRIQRLSGSDGASE
ncbi:MAG: heparinase II/III family protein, partial [Hyphomicrobiaceae bacterium]